MAASAHLCRCRWSDQASAFCHCSPPCAALSVTCAALSAALLDCRLSSWPWTARTGSASWCRCFCPTWCPASCLVGWRLHSKLACKLTGCAVVVAVCGRRCCCPTWCPHRFRWSSTLHAARELRCLAARPHLFPRPIVPPCQTACCRRPGCPGLHAASGGVGRLGPGHPGCRPPAGAVPGWVPATRSFKAPGGGPLHLIRARTAHPLGWLAALPCAAGRAIVDEVLPPRFLAEAVPHLETDSLGLAVVQQTGAWWVAGRPQESLQLSHQGG